MNKLSHTLAPEIKKIVQDGNDIHFVEELKKMSGKNWYREVKTISQNMGLNAKELIHKVANSLENALSGKEIKKDLDHLKQYYQDSFQEFEEVVFERSEKVTDAMVDYLQRAKDNILSIMLEGPEAKQRLIEQHKAILTKTSPSESKDSLQKKEAKSGVVEELSSSEVTIEANPENRVLSLLNDHSLSDEEKLEQISEDFRTQYQMQRMSWKKFADVFQLSQEYKKLFNKDISVKVLQNLFLLKHNSEDKTAKRVLDNALDPTYRPEGEQTLETPGVKVIGTIDLSRIPTKKPKEEKNIEYEVMQEPTTDSLAKVGEKMTIAEFLGASKLDYTDIRNYIMTWDLLPARYFWYNPHYSGKLSKTLNQHFFSVGQDKKTNGSTPLINVSILAPKDRIFNEWEIYKIVLKSISSKADYESNGQTHQIRGDLVVDIDIPEHTGSGNVIGESEWGKKLLQFRKEIS